MAGHADVLASENAIYIPPVNRALLEELNQHLRGFEASIALDLSASGPASDENPTPSAADLAGSLTLIGKAATLCESVNRLLRCPEGFEDIERDLSHLIQQIENQEQALASMNEKLRFAWTTAEDYRRRSFIAEEKLELLMSTVAQSLAQPPSSMAINCAAATPLSD